MDARPGGPAAKLQPSPEGLGIHPKDDLSAVGAALNLGPFPPVSLGADPRDLRFSAKRKRPAPFLVAGLSPVKLWSLAEASALLTKWASADELLYRQV